MLVAHGVTHIGHTHKSNEDVLLVDLDLGLFLVADGLGGHTAVGVAAQLSAGTRGLDDETLEDVMGKRRGDSAALAAQQRLDSALERRGNDNITALLLKRTA